MPIVTVNEIAVATREGSGVVVSRKGEWIEVWLELKKKTIKTSLYLVDVI